MPAAADTEGARGSQDSDKVGMKQTHKIISFNSNLKVDAVKQNLIRSMTNSQHESTVHNPYMSPPKPMLFEFFTMYFLLPLFFRA